MQAEVVSREVFVPSPGPGVGVMGGSYYTEREGGRLQSVHSLTSRSDTVDAAYVRVSEDNGRTWGEATPWAMRFEHPDGTGRRHPGGRVVPSFMASFTPPPMSALTRTRSSFSFIGPRRATPGRTS